MQDLDKIFERLGKIYGLLHTQQEAVWAACLVLGGLFVIISIINKIWIIHCGTFYQRALAFFVGSILIFIGLAAPLHRPRWVYVGDGDCAGQDDTICRSANGDCGGTTSEPTPPIGSCKDEVRDDEVHDKDKAAICWAPGSLQDLDKNALWVKGGCQLKTGKVYQCVGSGPHIGRKYRCDPFGPLFGTDPPLPHGVSPK